MKKSLSLVLILSLSLPFQIATASEDASPVVSQDMKFGVGGRLELDKMIWSPIKSGENQILAIEETKNPVWPDLEFKRNFISITTSGKINRTFGMNGFQEIPSIKNLVTGSIIRLSDKRFVTPLRDLFYDPNQTIYLNAYTPKMAQDSLCSNVNNNISRFVGVSRLQVSKYIPLKGGGLLAIGRDDSSPSDVAIFTIKILPNCEVDSTYGNDGIQIINVTSGKDTPNSAVEDGRGNVYLLARSNGLNGRSVVIKLRSNGSIDQTFANNGLYFLAENAEAISIHLDSESIQLVYRVSDPSYMTPLEILRITRNGVIRSDFGINGVWKSSTPKKAQGYYDIAYDEASGLLVVSVSSVPPNDFEFNQVKFEIYKETEKAFRYLGSNQDVLGYTAGIVFDTKSSFIGFRNTHKIGESVYTTISERFVVKD